MLASTVGYLKSHPGYVSGESISKQLRLSRAAVWKHIQDLRRKGYVIAAIPRQGYHLVSCPDQLFPWEIQNGLGTRNFGQKFIYHKTLSSTMDEAAKQAALGAPEGLVVCAETQTKGRGRFGRVWGSPAGQGIYLSIILRPPLALTEVAKLTLVAAVAVCQALRLSSGADVRIKWPNDLLVGRRKLTGILTELSAETDRVKFVILGVGVNVNTPRRRLPAGATSLKVVTGQSFRRVIVMQEILRSLEKWYTVFLEQGFEPVRHEWKALSMMFGQNVRLRDGKNEVVGQSVDLAPDGGLLIRVKGGEIVKKISGEVLLTPEAH